MDLSILIFNATILRALRMLRVFRVVKIMSGVQRLLKTLKQSIPPFLNVGALLFLLYFVYGVAGMSLFGKLKHGEFINEHANFEDFYNSVITLFRASTGESWNGLMFDCFGYECKGTSEECGNPIYAVVFWLSYTALATFVFINIFIAVILEGFENVDEEDLWVN